MLVRLSTKMTKLTNSAQKGRLTCYHKGSMNEILEGLKERKTMG